jgi:hypothetical protein
MLQAHAEADDLRLQASLPSALVHEVSGCLVGG